MFSERDCSLVSVGIDWLTATSTNDEAIIDAIQTFNAIDGEVKDYEFMGYVGRVKENIFVGSAYSPGQTRPHMIRVSGSECLNFVKSLGWGYVDDWRASRLDIQVTYQLDEPMAIGDLLYERSDVNATQYYKNQAGAVTTYINRRSGDAFARVYDKGLESGLTDIPGLIWRFEVELKRVMAAMYFTQICSDGLDEKRVAEKVGAMVWGWFADRKIDIPRPYNIDYAKVDIPREESDNERKLAWMKKQVRKSLHKLCDDLGESVVAEALGLTKIERFNLPSED